MCLYILLDKRNSKTDMKVTVFKRKGSMDAGVRPQSKVFTGGRPQSKVASDCTLAPDPRPADSTLVPDPRPADSTLVPDPRPADSTLAPDPGAAGSTLAPAPGAANSNHVTGGAVDIRCIKH